MLRLRERPIVRNRRENRAQCLLAVWRWAGCSRPNATRALTVSMPWEWQ
jgi:hypothetical protein